MMQWIDAAAAPALVLLLIAAAGGFFVHERWRLPVDYVHGAVSARAVSGWWALSGCAALGLAWLIWNMGHGGTAVCTGCVDWIALDRSVSTWVQQQAGAWWLPVVRALTQLGHWGWMAAMGIGCSLYLLYRRAWLLLGIWVLGVAGTGLCVRLIKHGVARERPEVRWVLEQGYSFPSGHSAGTLVCYGLMAWLWLCMVGRVRYRCMLVAGTMLLVAAVGASRVLLGAHYVSDVLAGWLLGLAWLALVVAMADAVRCLIEPRTVK